MPEDDPGRDALGAIAPRVESGPYRTLTGYEGLSGVELVDQSPIGRSPRSNPVTYVKAFDPIRKVFAATVDARAANFMGQNDLGTSGADSASSIVFYPDGSTSDAKLTLTNERCFVEIKIRGLTGTIRVSDLLAAEELTNSGGSPN